MENSERVAVEHRGTRVRAGALGEESFSPSPKVTVRWGSLDTVKRGRLGWGSRFRVSGEGLGGAHGKSRCGFLHQGIPHQNLASSQNSKLAVNWLYTKVIFAVVGSRSRGDFFSSRLTASV